jgi:type IV conjugative transfer system protein TraE
MKFSLVRRRALNFEYQRNVLLGLATILLLLLMILAFCLLLRNERTIVLPPKVRREFWVEGNRFSPEYLEEQAVYMIHLALDVNQATYPYNTEILLRYADAETSNQLREKFQKTMDRLKNNDVSTKFEVKEVVEVSFRIFRGRLFLKDL